MEINSVAQATQHINQADAELVKALGSYNVLICIGLAAVLLSPLVMLSVWLSKASVEWNGLLSLVGAFGLLVLIARYRASWLLKRFYRLVAECEIRHYSVYRPAGLYKSIRVTEHPAPASAFSIYSAQQPLTLSSYFHSFNGRGFLRLEI